MNYAMPTIYTITVKGLAYMVLEVADLTVSCVMQMLEISWNSSPSCFVPVLMVPGPTLMEMDLEMLISISAGAIVKGSSGYREGAALILTVVYNAGNVHDE